MSEQAVESFAAVGRGIRLCYIDQGRPEDTVILLIAGLGQHLHAWPDPFVTKLLDAGFRVIRFDNRDSGRSTHVRRPAPSVPRQLAGRPRRDAYSLWDLAADAVGLLNRLDVGEAHLVGMSMGGMIAQTIAARYPKRVLSLISLISTTGAPRVGGAAWSTKARLARKPATHLGAFVAAHLDMTGHLAGTAYPFDEDTEREYAARAWTRGNDDPGARGAAQARQIQAIQASGDRTRALRNIVAPTLVIHGDRDLIVRPSGGHATAAAIPGSRHITIPGMGHHLAPGLYKRLAELVVDHARSAATPPTPRSRTFPVR